MKLNISPGLYVVAVSGGVDSMVLLDLLQKVENTKIVVAHFDHGIRKDSNDDRKLVQIYCKDNNLQFVYDEGNLGSDASEEVARKARYKFLRKVKDSTGSKAIVTAHHKDDLLETAIINLLRGTGRKGFTSLDDTDEIIRPLLHYTKVEILKYAYQNKIIWREDSTNSDTKYLRNYIRHKLLPNISDKEKAKLLSHIKNTKVFNKQIDEDLTSVLHIQPALNKLDRNWFIQLPHEVAAEVLKVWLEKHKAKNINRKLVLKLVNACRVSQPNRVADVDKNLILEIGNKDIKITARDQ